MQLTTRIPFTSATLLITAAASGITQTVPRPDQRVEASNGVVAAAHPLAARAGLDMLRSGGNAVDAAIATAFAVGVVEPMMSGIGGGGSLTLWLDSAGTAWHVEFYPSSPGSPDYALDSVDEDEAIRDSLVPPERWAAVPGAVAGLLATHERFGRLPRETVLAPAIRLARSGFPVHALLGAVIVEEREKLQYDPRARELFLPEGSPLQPGDTLRQPDLAATLALIAREGRDGFYRGPVAEQVVAALRRGENPITLADLAAFEPRWRRPLCGIYRGFTVLSAPPPLAGSEVLQTLALLEPFDLEALGLPITSGEALAAVVDAIRVARTDYDRWIGDPRDVGVPAVGMVSAEYADERRAMVGIGTVPDTLASGDPWDEERIPLPDACALAGAFPPTTLPRAEDEPTPVGSSGEDAQTTHLSVIDADGNAVSLTYTLGLYFGSGAYAAGAFYNTAAANFGGPAANRRGPFRAPRSSTTPTLVLEDGRIRMAVGSPASGRIAPAIVHTILYTLDYGLDPWTAVAMPRVYPFFDSREVRLEMGFAAEALAELSGRGYELTVRPAYDMYFGGVHVVLVSDDGTLIGAADPRREGVAVGY